MMNKQIFKYLALGVMALIGGACNDSESDLLEPKVYFESKEYTIKVEEEDEVRNLAITSRLSSKSQTQVEVNYCIADASVVADYNARYGTNYEMFDAANVKLINTSTQIPVGQLYAEEVRLELTNLKSLKAGKPLLLPVRIASSSLSTETGTDIVYFFVNKPLKLKKAAEFGRGYISVRFPDGTFFKSFTYEALLNVDYFNGNSTIMGTEGVMIFRIGDTGGGVAGNLLQAAGKQNYYTKEGLSKERWYHVALTYDQPSGKTVIYVNGEKWAESGWGIPGFNPNSDIGFNIGKLPGFQWGQRPLIGKMCEVRLWSVARTPNQLKQDMFGVDPTSDGLELYYKLDGSEDLSQPVVKDATGKVEGKTASLSVVDLDSPIVIN